MAKGPKFEFKIAPGGLDGPTPKRFVDKNLMNAKPTDANQMAPTESQPVPARYRMAGGC